MIFGLVYLLFLIFLISIGISTEEYAYSYFGIFMLTICLWGGINASIERKYDGCLPDAIFFLALFAWLILSATGDLGEYFEIFMLAYFVIVITFIIVSVNLESNTKHEKLKITSKEDDKIRAQIILDNLNWVRVGSLQSDTPTYLAYRNNSPNIADFDWVLEYIMIYGSNHNSAPSNFNTDKNIYINKNLYLCNKVNDTYTVTQIYRQPISDVEKTKLEVIGNSKAASNTKSITEAKCVNILTNTSEPTIENAIENMKRFKDDIIDNNGSDVYTQIIKNNINKNRRKVEKRLREDPVVQYNIQLIKDLESDLKKKIEEYKELRSRQDDEIFISHSTTGMIDFEEYESQLEDMRDEISDLKDEILELREEIEEIHEDIENEIEDKEWERGL